MTWSTRQVAELSGTTLRTVRHYHEVGLLEEPERQANGYKSYGVRHVARVLRIRRLTELGLSLAQIARIDARPTRQALRELDAELAGTIARLERSRRELGAVLEGGPGELAPELPPAVLVAGLPAAHRELVVVMSRVLGPVGLAAFAECLAGDHTRPEQILADAPCGAVRAAATLRAAIRDVDAPVRRDVVRLVREIDPLRREIGAGELVGPGAPR